LVVGVIAGTLQYMTPEQIEGQLVDERCDIFALGAIVRACSRGGPRSLAYRVVNDGGILIGQPAPLRTLLPDVSPALANVVHEVSGPSGRPSVGRQPPTCGRGRSPRRVTIAAGRFDRLRTRAA